MIEGKLADLHHESQNFLREESKVQTCLYLLIHRESLVKASHPSKQAVDPGDSRATRTSGRQGPTAAKPRSTSCDGGADTLELDKLRSVLEQTRIGTFR